MSIQDKFSRIFQEDNSDLSVVSFDGDMTDKNIAFKISTLLKFANDIFHGQALELIDQRLRECGVGSLSIIMQAKEKRRQNKNNWNMNGIDAEILEPNTQGWKKGKIRMRVVLEFCPDEPISNNSPLDDIRQTINK